MSTTPVFDEVFAASNPFSVLPAEYTDRFTPEVARQQGVVQGAVAERQRWIKAARQITKPTKQILDLIDQMEAAEDE